MKKMNYWQLVTLLLVIIAAPPVFAGYLELESSAVKSSSRLNALRYEREGAQEQSRLQQTLQAPRLVLDGYYRYSAIVPEIVMAAPLNRVIKMGDNAAYSFGPTASWVAWDHGALSNLSKSSAETAMAKKYEYDGLERQVKLIFAKTYFQTVLLYEQVLLLTDAQKLAESQYHDIQVSARAGAKSKKDELSAHALVLERQRQKAQAEADYSVSALELASQAGYTDDTAVNADTSKSGITDALATLGKLESSETLMQQFEKYGAAKLWSTHPDIAVFDKLAEAACATQDSMRAGVWPKVVVSARSSLDYPNGPTLESIHQNTASVNISLPLFESGQSGLKEKMYKNNEHAARERQHQKQKDLTVLWQQAHAQLDKLYEQDAINTAIVTEATELSAIVYKSYAAGSATFVEVENANFKLIEARLQQTRTRVQILVQYAVLRSLAE